MTGRAPPLLLLLLLATRGESAKVLPSHRLTAILHGECW